MLLIMQYLFAMLKAACERGLGFIAKTAVFATSAGNNAKQLKRGFLRTVSSSSQERDNVRDDHLEISRFRECDFTSSRAFTAFEGQRNHGRS
jgi:hypothetical protein